MLVVHSTGVLAFLRPFSSGSSALDRCTKLHRRCIFRSFLTVLVAHLTGALNYIDVAVNFTSFLTVLAVHSTCTLNYTDVAVLRPF